MKAITERGRYESLPIFFGCDAIDLQLSIDHAFWRMRNAGTEGPRIQTPGVTAPGTITGPRVSTGYKNESHKWDS